MTQHKFNGNMYRLMIMVKPHTLKLPIHPFKCGRQFLHEGEKTTQYQ